MAVRQYETASAIRGALEENIVFFGSQSTASGGIVSRNGKGGRFMYKAEQRQIARQLRRELSRPIREAASAAICRHLQQMPQMQKNPLIFSYSAMPYEVNLHEFHIWASEQGIRLAFPVTRADGTMEAYSPFSDTCWVRDRFGIPAPVAETAQRILPQEITLILTPCIAFDEGCHRLGQGGGYYDRFFLRCPNAFRLGIAFEAQKLPQICCGAHDIALNAIQTEEKYYGIF